MQCLICSETIECSELSFWGEVICPACECLLMEASVTSLEYEQLVSRIKLMWQKKLLDYAHRLKEYEQI